MPELRQRPVRPEPAATFTPAADDPNAYRRAVRDGRKMPNGTARGFRNGMPVKFYVYRGERRDG